MAWDEEAIGGNCSGIPHHSVSCISLSHSGRRSNEHPVCCVQTLPRNMLHMFGTASLFTFFWWCYSIVPRNAAVFVQFCDNFTFLEFPSRRVWLDLKHRKKRRAKHFSRRTALARPLGRCREGLVWAGIRGRNRRVIILIAEHYSDATAAQSVSSLTHLTHCLKSKSVIGLVNLVPLFPQHLCGFL